MRGIFDRRAIFAGGGRRRANGLPGGRADAPQIVRVGSVVCGRRFDQQSEARGGVAQSLPVLGAEGDGVASERLTQKAGGGSAATELLKEPRAGESQDLQGMHLDLGAAGRGALDRSLQRFRDRGRTRGLEDRQDLRGT